MVKMVKISNAKMMVEARNIAMVTMVRISNMKNSQRFQDSNGSETDIGHNGQNFQFEKQS